MQAKSPKEVDVERVVQKAIPVVKANLPARYAAVKEEDLIEAAKKQLIALPNKSNELKDQYLKNVKTAKQYVEIAKNDLEAVKTLYERKSFANSTYHLQQAVEKLAKAYALAFFLISETELKRKVSHKSPKVFTEAIKKEEFKEFINMMKVLDQNLKTDVTGLEETIDKKFLELAKLTKEQILGVVDTCNALRSGLKEIDITGILSSVQSLFAQDFSSEELQEGNEIIERLRQGLKMKLVASFASTYLLSAITYAHEAYTRYPNLELTPSDYKEGLGIVDATPLLIPLIEQAIDDLETHLK